jgi:hypothetical protein
VFGSIFGGSKQKKIIECYQLDNGHDADIMPAKSSSMKTNATKNNRRTSAPTKTNESIKTKHDGINLSKGRWRIVDTCELQDKRRCIIAVPLVDGIVLLGES